jgi:cellobiose-specific phosphotransferase system component IIB
MERFAGISPHDTVVCAMADDLIPDLLAAVEQQLVSPQTRYVAQTLERLTKAGLEEVEAKHQIALCLGEEMDQVLRKKRGFDEKAYREALDGLPLEPLEDEG